MDEMANGSSVKYPLACFHLSLALEENYNYHLCYCYCLKSVLLLSFHSPKFADTQLHISSGKALGQ